jgi:hypothetical protein
VRPCRPHVEPLEARCLLAGGPVVTGLTQWLEANVGVTASSSGNVSAWGDQSGLGNSASQAASGSQPLLVKTGLNGKPVLQFNGTSDWMQIAGQPLTSQQFTILAVVTDTRASGDTEFREVWSNWSTSNEGTSVFLGTTNNNPVRARFTDDMGGANDQHHNQTGVGRITNPADPFIFTGLSGATDATIYQNARLMADHGAPLSNRDLGGQYNIGTQLGTTSGELWQGDIAEILIYNRELSASELHTDWSYLQEKYSLLPATRFVVGGPSSVTAGTPFTVAATALDTFNHGDTGYTGTVQFTTTDANHTLPANYPFTAADKGKHTLTNGVTLVRAEWPTAPGGGEGMPGKLDELFTA